MLIERFAEVLNNLRFDDEVMGWVAEALRQSHGDQKRFHEDAIVRLRDEYDRRQQRIERMYVDKLGGNVDAAYFDRMSSQWRDEQSRISADIETHQAADQGNMEDGIKLLDLARRAHHLFEKQEGSKKGRLLKFVLSNSTWKDGDLHVEYRQPSI